MTKLEAKLIELGYGKIKVTDFYSNKRPFVKHRKSWSIRINVLYNQNNKIEHYIEPRYIYSQHQIDNLQLAFNEMQKDLEELKSCQN